jgi:hypothetical protein
MSVDITFVRWHASVAPDSIVRGHRSGDKFFQNATNETDSSGEVNSKGVYGIYDGIFFGVYKVAADKETKWSVCIGSDIFDISSATVMTHEASLRKTIFSIRLENKPIVFFAYRKLFWVFLHGNMADKAGYFFDDWWGIECDLPSWVVSTFEGAGISGIASGLETMLARTLPLPPVN